MPKSAYIYSQGDKIKQKLQRLNIQVELYT